MGSEMCIRDRYKGNIIVTGRKSQNSLYSEELVTFEDSQSDYDQSDAKGFIKLNALRLIKNKQNTLK